MLQWRSKANHRRPNPMHVREAAACWFLHQSLTLSHTLGNTSACVSQGLADTGRQAHITPRLITEAGSKPWEKWICNSAHEVIIPILIKSVSHRIQSALVCQALADEEIRPVEGEKLKLKISTLLTTRSVHYWAEIYSNFKTVEVASGCWATWLLGWVTIMTKLPGFLSLLGKTCRLVCAWSHRCLNVRDFTDTRRFTTPENHIYITTAKLHPGLAGALAARGFSNAIDH